MTSNLVDAPPHRLIIAAQYWSGDEARMMRVVRLLADIEPRRRDDVVVALVRRFDCPQSELALETMIYANEKFLTILLQSEREGVGHPAGCNALMAGAMDLLSDSKRRADLRAHSVFLIEADGVPICADWLDILIAAHRRTLAAGKRVTGPEMNQKPHVNGGLIAHLSLWRDRPSLHETPEGQAWDLFHADVFLAEARTTRAILNVYGENRWSPESLTNLSRESAWLCSQKDDSALAWAEDTLTVAARRRAKIHAEGLAPVPPRPRTIREGLVPMGPLDRYNGVPLSEFCMECRDALARYEHGMQESVVLCSADADKVAAGLVRIMDERPAHPPIRHYVTACRDYQLPVLFQSMVRHCQPFVLHVLAWDFDMGDFIDIRKTLARLDPATEGKLTTRAQFLARHPELATLPGPPRNTNETVCSVRWRFALDVMEATGQPVTLIDGDQHFFSSPESVFEEIGTAPYALSPHAFAPAADGVPGVTQESHGKFGRFNGGWSYWRDPVALGVMAQWSKEWCYQGFHDVGGRQLFGDQGWFDLLHEQWPGGGHVIGHPGVNTGPWNVNRWKVEEISFSVAPGTLAPTLYLDGRPLISFHFQSLKPGGQLFDPSYAVTPDREAIIYPPYLRALGDPRGDR